MALDSTAQVSAANSVAYLLRVLRLTVANLTNDTVKYNAYRKATFVLEETLCEYLGQSDQNTQLNYLTTYLNSLR